MPGTPASRAVELNGDRTVTVIERPTPQPGPTELRVAVHTIGLCATDREVRDGEMVYFVSGKSTYPVVPGHEWVGTVEAVGTEAEGFKVGDRVVGECSIGCGRCELCRSGRYHICPDRCETGLMGQDGALAEHLVFPARAAHVVPAAVSDEAAALIEPTAVAYNAVRVAGIEPADRVLVVGAGPIGLLALQVILATTECEVSICDLSAARLAMADALGSHESILISGERPLEVRAGWDVIIEASGSPGGFATALTAAKPEATVVCVSLYGQSTIPVDLDHLVTNDITIRGALGSPRRWPEVISLIASGKLDPGALVTGRFAFTDAADAFDRIGDPREVKVVIDMNRGGNGDR